jgi:hypothetical protein
MKKWMAPVVLGISIAGCSQEQIDATANAACSAATIEANAFAVSTDPQIKLAVVAVTEICADPSATAAQVNAARIMLKNALAKKRS